VRANQEEEIGPDGSPNGNASGSIAELDRDGPPNDPLGIHTSLNAEKTIAPMVYLTETDDGLSGKERKRGKDKKKKKEKKEKHHGEEEEEDGDDDEDEEFRPSAHFPDDAAAHLKALEKDGGKKKREELRGGAGPPACGPHTP